MMLSAIRDVVLVMVTYPQHTPDWALPAALAFAEHCDARVSAVVCQTRIPAVSNWIADTLVHANAVLAAENARSQKAAATLLHELGALSDVRRGLLSVVECGPMAPPLELARLARTHDLAVVPVFPEVDFRAGMEALLFDSGRPVLLLPEPGKAWPKIDKVIIGWDGSRPATSALSASLPFCQAARSVQLVSVIDDKPLEAAASLVDAQHHLACHGVSAVIEEVSPSGKNAGQVLMEHSARCGADLLVMGGYGHSRAREFVLGGATRSVLDQPQLPVLLAH